MTTAILTLHHHNQQTHFYDAGKKSYITLDNLALMAKQGIVFHILNAQTGQDETLNILRQIMQSSAQDNDTLSRNFLRGMIDLGHQSASEPSPHHGQAFEQIKNSQKNNHAMFDQTLALLKDYKRPEPAPMPQEIWADQTMESAPAHNQPETAPELSPEVQQKIAALQKMLDAITQKKK